MIRFLGGAIIIISAFLLGREKSRELQQMLAITLSLCSFIRHISERIGTFREPLGVIFDEYEDCLLKETGFLVALQNSKEKEALVYLKDKLLKDDFSTLSSFFQKLGGGDEKVQISLCSYTLEQLEKSAERQGEQLNSKVRVYRLIPALAAASFVIFFI